jgi:transmembrane sensor
MTTRSDQLPTMLRETLATHADGTELEQLWSALGSVPTGSATTAAERTVQWDAIMTRTAPAARPALTVVNGGAQRRRWVWALAAAIAFATVGMASAPRTDRWSSGTETDRVITLADGSTVQLAAGSTLSMPRRFGGWFGQAQQERAVTLDGQAFFTVARDGRPFIVRAPHASVRVLGTRFDVRDFRGDGSASVVVEEGRVRVSSTARGDSTELTAGERARIARDQALTVDTVITARLTAWRSGGLVLVDQSIDEVLHELERRYDLAFVVDSAVRRTERLTVYYPALPPIESVLGDVSTSRGLTYQRTSRGFRIGRE